MHGGCCHSCASDPGVACKPAPAPRSVLELLQPRECCPAAHRRAAVLEVKRAGAALPVGSARAPEPPALEQDAGLGQLTGPRWLCRCAETCNQDVNRSVREEVLNTGKRWPRRQ